MGDGFTMQPSAAMPPFQMDPSGSRNGPLILPNAKLDEATIFTKSKPHLLFSEKKMGFFVQRGKIAFRIVTITVTLPTIIRSRFFRQRPIT